ncbi:putative heterokaryon incompatibility protein [Botrytis fragariae]|uniref:Putative heterokaryon incompatibility protein n=1 Tax=Botrytis fragariae TaxID=1964551 RepID=A0A8H6AZJ0_9HELO|nr:putative heterokaryon incompatibility protein [Botrytis fragariae]KAF5876594.1 putative heterokaryon incompatibility protein [Botrytis fragariae]
MSGAAEGLAGLALSAINVVALFTTCIECFDIVIAGKNFGEDFEQLCALFSLERARSVLWGESVGSIPEPNTGLRLKYDVKSMRLLRGVTSSHKDSATLDVSETASSRMFKIEENGYITRVITKSSSTYGSSLSFKTALSKPSQDIDSLASSTPQPPEAWPRLLQSPNKNTKKMALLNSAIACEQCSYDEKKCVTKTEVFQCYSCIQTGKNCSFSRRSAEMTHTTSTSTSHETAYLDNNLTNESSTNQVSQNRRLMQGLVAVTGYRRHLSFSDGDKHFGNRLTANKNQDLEYWVHNSGKLVPTANTGTAALLRIFLELRDIRETNVPFISAITVNGCLNTILASIEGPPEKPFEGGIFWITIRITDRYPGQLPLMRFTTKIYHPNVSPQGYVRYADGQLQKYSKPLNNSDKWFLGSDRKLNWSLGALLTALCGLLSSPDVDNPLVPEIAQTNLEDYDEYCCNARLYTKMYAIDERPDESHLLFPDDFSEEINVVDFSHDDCKEEEPEDDFLSLQSSLREEQDIKLTG